MPYQKIKKIAEFVAIGGNILGALFIAILSAITNNIAIAILGYVFFIFGAIASIYLLKHSNASVYLRYVNYFFLVVNILGIVLRVW